MNKKEIKEVKDASDLDTKYQSMLKQLDETWDGLILNVTPTTSREFYGETGTYENRNGYSIEVKLQSPNGEIFKQFMSTPNDIRGLQKTNVHAFYKKYGSVPTKGMTITAKLNDSGFFEIVF